MGLINFWFCPWWFGLVWFGLVGVFLTLVVICYTFWYDVLQVSILIQYFSAHPNYCSRLFKQFICKQKDKIFTLGRIISVPSHKAGWHGLSPLQSEAWVLWGEGRSVPILRESDACKTPWGPRMLKCRATHGCCHELSSPGKMTPGSIVWDGVIHTFIGLVLLFNRAGIFPKPFPNPVLLREIPRIVNTSGFWILCLLILHKPADKRTVYALGKLAINLFSCMIWVSAAPYSGTSKSLWLGPVTCFAERNRLPFILMCRSWYLLN